MTVRPCRRRERELHVLVAEGADPDGIERVESGTEEPRDRRCREGARGETRELAPRRQPQLPPIGRGQERRLDVVADGVRSAQIELDPRHAADRDAVPCGFQIALHAPTLVARPGPSLGRRDGATGRGDRRTRRDRLGNPRTDRALGGVAGHRHRLRPVPHRGHGTVGLAPVPLRERSARAAPVDPHQRADGGEWRGARGALVDDVRRVGASARGGGAAGGVPRAGAHRVGRTDHR